VAGVPTFYKVTLTVTDNAGAISEATVSISVNNTPPVVNITTPTNNTYYPLSGSTIYNLTAQVTDNEQQASGLIYKWQTILHHNNHEHPEPYDTNQVTTLDVPPIGCDGETYYFRILLTVTDAAGLSATDEVRLYPNCGTLAADVTSLTSTTGNTSVTLNWSNPSSQVDEIIIVAKPTTGIAGVPSGDGSAYTADLNYAGVGSSFDGGKVVYKGLASPQIVTGLSNNTNYFFKVFTRVSTFWSDGVEVTATPTCPISTTQATNVSVSNITNNAMSVSWVNGNGSGRLVKMNTVDVFNNPVNGTTPTANTTYQSSGEQVIFNGSANSVNISGLNPNTTYYFRVYEYTCSGPQTAYDINTAINNPNNATTGKVVPVITWANPADIVYGMALSNT
ncbi:MAG: fibronectin type III domain-containing protein, partial [Bacteroidota bacterium]